MREDDDPDVDQPGLSALRSAAAFAKERLPGGGRLASEATAGATTTVGSVPDGMANALLAGVNPIYGLYANMVAPIVGGTLSSSRLMVINSTSATALVAGQALLSTPADHRVDALFLLVILAGVLQVAFGVLQLGRLTRFISFSVMTGFVAGIGVVLILSQLPTITGYDAGEGTAVTNALQLFHHLSQAHLPSLAVATATLALAIGLRRTPLTKVATLIALAIPSIIVAVVGADSIRLVGDIGEIQAGFPLPSLPSPSAFSGSVVSGAVAVAIVGVVQGAGVSQSAADPSEERSSTSRDFVAQGAANAVSGLVRGLPVGGSLSGTVLNVSSGGRGRLAVVSSGVWMIVLVVAFSGLLMDVAMPALGALLILVSTRTIKRDDVANVWGAGWPARIASLTTFGCTLLLPIQAAVAIGVVLAALLHVAAASNDVSIVQLLSRPDGQIEERRPPEHLPERSVTVLNVYGSLFYGDAPVLERRLPPPGGDGTVVVLRLRGRPALGATVVDVLASYAERLREAGGRLYVAGVSESARSELLRNERLQPAAGVETYPATRVVGESTRAAHAAAEEWLVTNRDEDLS